MWVDNDISHFWWTFTWNNSVSSYEIRIEWVWKEKKHERIKAKTQHTVLSDDDLAHLLQAGDQQLVGHNQYIADKLHVQRLCRT